MSLNLEEFLGMQTNESTSTQVILIPEGDYPAMVDSDGIGLADFKYKQGERAGQTGYRMTVKWVIQDDDGSVERAIGRKPVITQSVMLDVTPEGGLDMGEGRNIQLGRLREAVDQNRDGQPWQPAMLIGQMARIMVKHSVGTSGDPMQNVDRVTKL